jgi:glyoxylase-like metal-dependent hydrolase (beta-lactamase superfamily II)
MAEQNNNLVLMAPIKGATRAKRLKWGDPNDRNNTNWIQNNLSWTFQQMFREGNDTRKVYEINPYIEVYQYTDNMYGLWNPSLATGGDVWQYLIIGPEKAMLIDTAWGLGNQKGLVDKITGGMPLIVANTHYHSDHALGNVLYDRVYCHEYDMENIKTVVKPGAWDRFSNEYVEYDLNDLPEYKDYELIGVPHGHIFNLGGDYDIELFWTAGHSAGQAMFIDRKGRNIFAGDDVISDRISCGAGPQKGLFYQEYCNLTSYRDRLDILCTRLDEFDYIFSGHFANNLENSVLLNILEALNEVIADPKRYTYKEETISSAGTRSVAFYKQIKGLGRIRYTENGVYPSKA